MSGRLIALFAVIIGFGALSVAALLEVGYVNVFLLQLRSWAGAQVLFDLVILALLACIWMFADARARGTSPWPFIAITLFAGAFGPLLYLVIRELRSPAQRPVSA
jgi:hypothetical protein